MEEEQSTPTKEESDNVMKNISFEDIVEVFGDKKDLETIVNQGKIINQLFMWMPRFLVRHFMLHPCYDFMSQK